MKPTLHRDSFDLTLRLAAMSIEVARGSQGGKLESIKQKIEHAFTAYLLSFKIESEDDYHRFQFANPVVFHKMQELRSWLYLFALSHPNQARSWSIDDRVKMSDTFVAFVKTSSLSEDEKRRQIMRRGTVSKVVWIAPALMVGVIWDDNDLRSQPEIFSVDGLNNIARV